MVGEGVGGFCCCLVSVRLARGVQGNIRGGRTLSWFVGG